MKSIRKHLQKISLLFSFSILFVSCTQYDEIITEELNISNNSSNSKILARGENNYSGRELFKGLFFVNGEVADKLININNSYSYNLIKNLDALQTEKYNIEIENIITYIEQKHPEFFVDFKNKIESGSHIIINEALSEGAKMLFASYVNKYIQQNQKESFVNELNKIDLSKYTNIDTKVIDYEKLHNDIQNNPNFNSYSQTCASLFAGVVFVVAAYVLVVHAAAAMTYVYAAWVVHSYAAVTKSKTITKGTSKGTVINDPTILSIDEELLINEIAENLATN